MTVGVIANSFDHNAWEMVPDASALHLKCNNALGLCDSVTALGPFHHRIPRSHPAEVNHRFVLPGMVSLLRILGFRQSAANNFLFVASELLAGHSTGSLTKLNLTFGAFIAWHHGLVVLV